MSSASYTIRIKAAQALTLPSILYKGIVVPVYDEIADTDAPFPRITLMDVSTGVIDNSKCGFGGDWTQLIKVSDAMIGGRTKNAIEIIANEVIKRLCPFKGPFLDLSPTFTVWDVSFTELSSNSYTDGKRQYIDKNIRITYSLTEIS